MQAFFSIGAHLSEHSEASHCLLIFALGHGAKDDTNWKLAFLENIVETISYSQITSICASTKLWAPWTCPCLHTPVPTWMPRNHGSGGN